MGYLRVEGSDIDVANLVRNELRRRVPVTARRLGWDSDGGELTAMARRREDIVRVARVRNALHRERRALPIPSDE